MQCPGCSQKKQVTPGRQWQVVDEVNSAASLLGPSGRLFRLEEVSLVTELMDLMSSDMMQARWDGRIRRRVLS